MEFSIQSRRSLFETPLHAVCSRIVRAKSVPLRAAAARARGCPPCRIAEKTWWDCRMMHSRSIEDKAEISTYDVTLHFRAKPCATLRRVQEGQKASTYVGSLLESSVSVLCQMGKYRVHMMLFSHLNELATCRSFRAVSCQILLYVVISNEAREETLSHGHSVPRNQLPQSKQWDFGVLVESWASWILPPLLCKIPDPL
ncbi:hypothetical protein BT67DRAFT_295676 [Trichocladium antarcticum]|uniref:Uncharacterized protein n=1 Tax=Trichocladium antarcticum TaxID=1450529 RepID=A0AAN6ZEG3_9PEZI|nr:hypothetical protein BT67DRAFT_295676 [Trichocladium antarcticum]